MDDNTFKLGLSIIAALQVVGLAWVSYRQQRNGTKIDTVHQLVNGMSHEKETAIAAAAHLEGELKGRDFERGRRLDDKPPAV